MRYSKFIILIMALSQLGCSRLYYKSWEIVGQDKRDLLSSNILELNDEQEEVKKEFSSVLQRIRTEYKFKENKLSNTYDKMNRDYIDLEEEVSDIKSRVDKIENIALDLFDEWKEEAKGFESKKYKRSSLKKLKITKFKFRKIIQSARRNEQEMSKTLKKFKDQVVFIKHNLNAHLLSQLSINLKNLENEMENLLSRIEHSIIDAKNFTKLLK